MGKVDHGGAVDADGAQVARELARDEPDPVAVQLRVRLLREHEAALALAVGDEGTHPLELLAPDGGRGVLLCGERGQYVGDARERDGERRLDLVHQALFRHEARRRLRDLPLVLEHGVPARQLR